jgi:hypothetical protein
MSQGHNRKAARHLPILALLIEALEDQDSHDRHNEGRALRAFAELALKQVPTRGVFAPKEPDLDKELEAIARKYLDFGTPRKQFFDATAKVEPFAMRDQIESAANHLISVSDDAYYYAGLAFGVTLVDFCSLR